MKHARLNVQGLARRSPELMNCFVSDPGHIFVSSDASAGEPTVITEFSKDLNYYDATFGMVGKVPYYKGDILKIDDIYLTGMSVSPMGAKKLRDIFHSKFKGVSFSEQWVLDAEVIKSQLKDDRQFHKILILGLGYGMGPRKMVTSAYEKGYNLDMAAAKAFHTAYWTLFAGIRRFADHLANMADTQKYIVNPFGYRLKCEPQKALNYFIQSSVSGLFHIYCREVFERAPYAKFETVIHDELITQIPDNKLEHFRQVIKDATDALNAGLEWSVKLRFGCVEGTTLYEAK